MIKIIRIAAILITFLILWNAGNCAAQFGAIEERKLDEPHFDIDLAAFKSNSPNEVDVELYYKIYNDGLKFFKKQDQFVANYEINVIVLGEDNSQLTGTSMERFYRLSNYQETRNTRDFLINMIPLRLGIGKYKIVCKLLDKNSAKVSSCNKEFKITSLFKGAEELSDIEFIRAVEELDTMSSRFDKGEKRIIPAVTRVYGEEIPQISFYAELYHTEAANYSAKLSYEIHDAKQKKVYTDELEVTLDKPITRLIKHIPLENFLPGNYMLIMTLLTESGKKLVSSQSSFEIAWSLDALIRNDYDLALEQLKYVARKNDLDILKKAAPEDRKKAFMEFWKKHDPTPETPENEKMEEYYERIRIANKLFSSIHKEGWRTDMGMIYIIYGEPDNIEQHPFELSEKPYQIWYYYSPSRTFGFKDEMGTGEYELQFPYDGRRGFIDDRFDDYN